MAGNKTISSSFTVNVMEKGDTGPQGPAATAYNLIPSVSEIVLRKDGTYAPTSVSCYCTSITNGVATDNPSEATMQYSYNGTSWSNFSYTATFSSSTISTNGGKLYLQLLVNSKVMDKRTISIVKDGDKGDTGDGYTLKATPTSLVFNPNTQLFVGGSTITITATHNGASFTSGSLVVYAVDSSGNTNYTPASLGVAFSASSAYVRYDAYLSVNSVQVASTSIPIARYGANGEAGRTGRMFYMMGEWTSGTTYTRTDLTVPMVFVESDEYNQALGVYGDYWYLNVDSSSTKPGDGNTDWVKAVNFGVIITQGIFADFAKLGEAVMSGNYMFSTNGRIFNEDFTNNGNWKGYPAYTYFEGDPVSKDFFAIPKNLNVSYTTWTALHDYIYLSKDETLVMRIYADTLASNNISIAFFNNNTRLSFEYWNGSSWVTYSASESRTIYEDTEYYFKITAPSSSSYYQMRALSTGTSSAFVYAYIKRILFEPVWWVNLRTGKSSMAKGALIAANDTVKIDNLYKSVTLSWGNSFFRTLEPDGTTSMYVFIKRDADDATQADTATLVRKYGLKKNTYFKLTEDMIASGEFDGSGMLDGNYNNRDFVPCVGKADIVCLLDDGNSYWPDGGYIYLPRPQDFNGKTIEVRHNTTLGTGRVNVTTVSNVANGMAYGPYLDTNIGSATYRKIVFKGTAAYFTYNSGQVLTFYSNGSKWIRLSRQET